MKAEITRQPGELKDKDQQDMRNHSLVRERGRKMQPVFQQGQK